MAYSSWTTRQRGHCSLGCSSRAVSTLRRRPRSAAITIMGNTVPEMRHCGLRGAHHAATHTQLSRNAVSTARQRRCTGAHSVLTARRRREVAPPQHWALYQHYARCGGEGSASPGDRKTTTESPSNWAMQAACDARVASLHTGGMGPIQTQRRNGEQHCRTDRKHDDAASLVKSRHRYPHETTKR